MLAGGGVKQTVWGSRTKTGPSAQIHEYVSEHTVSSIKISAGVLSVTGQSNY